VLYLVGLTCHARAEVLNLHEPHEEGFVDHEIMAIKYVSHQNDSAILDTWMLIGPEAISSCFHGRAKW
jgi:hypothetical protein